LLDSPLYKLFRFEEHAAEFVENGRFRLGSLRAYQKIEDVDRVDPTESMSARATVDGGMKTMLFANPVFTLCTTRAIDSAAGLVRKFGCFAVCIDDPAQLCLDITGELNAMLVPIMHPPKWRHVEYNKGELVRTSEEPFNFAMIQKPRSYSHENEARLFFSVLESGPKYELLDFLELNLKKRLQYCRKLDF
jgi:hypothetical protein